VAHLAIVILHFKRFFALVLKVDAHHNPSTTSRMENAAALGKIYYPELR
jgi:hypothetical protein